MIVKTLLNNAVIQLNTAEAKLEAQLLLEHVLGVNHAWLISHAGDPIDTQLEKSFSALVERRLQGEPIAYILGEREFFGLPFKVTTDTLIPRPDTETLVDAALEKVGKKAEAVLDLGTGSGAIALSIAQHRPDVMVTAVDFSAQALQVAEQNAANLSIHNVRFLQSDWFADIDHQTFDVIVSNPPYIEAQDAHLKQGDLRFEPISALAAGEDGLDDIHQILADCLIYLKPQAWLLFEHGYQQAEAVQALMAETGLTDIETMQDLGGNDRVTMGKNPLVINQHWD